MCVTRHVCDWPNTPPNILPMYQTMAVILNMWRLSEDNWVNSACVMDGFMTQIRMVCWKVSLLMCGTSVITVSTLCAVCVSNIPCVLSLSVAISLYSDECVSEADCNNSSVISKSMSTPDSTVSQLDGHWGLWFGSWHRHGIVLGYKMCTLTLLPSSSYWGFTSKTYSTPNSKIHHNPQSSAKVYNVWSQTTVSRIPLWPAA